MVNPEELFVRFVETADDAALESLLAHCEPLLLRQVERLGFDGADADDLVQETIVAAIEQADRYDRARPLVAWLRGILTRKAARVVRDRHRHRAKLEAAEPRASTHPAPLERATERELVEILRRTLAAMPTRYREPLELHLLEGLEPVEIAQMRGERRSTVRVRLHRGMGLLRRDLPRGLTVAAAAALAGSAAARTAPPTADGVPIARPTELHAARPRGPVPRRPRSPWLHAAWAGAFVTLVSALVLVMEFAAPPAASAPVDTVARDGAERRVELVHSAPRREVSSSRVDHDAGDLRVHVLNGAGQPVAAVGLVIEPAAGVTAHAHRRRAVTDATGTARVGRAAAPAGELRIRADRGPERVIDPTIERDVTLTLEDPGGRLTGVVVDVAGVPVGGAMVWLSDAPDDPWSGEVVTRADEYGRFELDHVPARSYVAARAPGHGRSSVVQIDVGDAAAAAGRATLIEVRLAPFGARLAGVVRDEFGQPVADARVLVGDSVEGADIALAGGTITERAPPIELRTDRSGAFVAAGLEPGVHPIVVRSARYQSFARYLRIGREDGDRRVEITLQPGGYVSGVVVDARGEPIAGAHVLLRGMAAHSEFDLRSDDAGAFRFDGLPRGPIALAARARGYFATALDVHAVAEPQPVRVVLTQLHRLRGRVLSDAGEAISGCAVRVGFDGHSSIDGGRRTARSDGEGWFDLPHDGRALPVLEVREEGAPLWVDVAPEFHAGELRVVVPAARRASCGLEGVLTTAAGAPVAAARLHLRSSSGRWQEVSPSDLDGRFVIGRLPPDRYTLFAESTRPETPSFVAGVWSVAGGRSRRIEAQSAESGTLRWQLRRPDDAALHDLVVTVVDHGLERRLTFRRDASGSQALLPGTYRFYAMASTIRWVDGIECTIRAGETTSLNLEVEPAQRVRLALHDLEPARGMMGNCRIVRRGDGAFMGEFSVPLDTPRPNVLQAFLPIGRYDVRLETSLGGRFASSFSIDGLDPAFDPVRVPMRPVQ